LTVYFSTESNLESLAKRRTDHLYVDLLPCSEEPFGDYLYSGTVFIATEEERGNILGQSPSAHTRLYKALISLDYERMLNMKTNTALDVPHFLSTVKRDGLCMWVGGAQMCCFSLVSNLVDIPLEIREKALVIRDESRRK
jgi:hypothetical protein